MTQMTSFTEADARTRQTLAVESLTPEYQVSADKPSPLIGLGPTH